MEWILGVAGLVITVLMGIGGWMMTSHENRMKKQDERMDELATLYQSIPGIYARRDDVRDMKNEILTAVRDLSSKVDGLRHG